MRFKQFLPFLLLIIPALLVYKSLFLSSNLAFGDAPYFYPENLAQLFSLPLQWESRNDNFGAGQGFVMWLYLPTFLMGLFSKLGLSHDFLVRMVFYFPAVILSFCFSYQFLRKKVNSTLPAILGSFFYGFNTYFLSVLDGGQIGLALSYGLFPLMVDKTIQFLENPSKRLFCLSLLSFLLISNTDIRLFVIGLTLITILTRKIVKILILLLSTFLIDLFWIIPFVIQYFSGSLSQANVQTSLISILDSLTVFQPHFPLNEFGNLVPPPFYFVILPALLVIGLYLAKSNKKLFRDYSTFFLIYLIFVFLAKGQNEPFGQAYLILVNKIPLGFSLRDSSKFYIPLILSVSVLLTLLGEKLVNLKDKRLKIISLIAIFLYLNLTIYPALFGKLSGNLGILPGQPDHQFIYSKLNTSFQFARTVWFPEKPQLAFSFWQVPAISADTLFRDRPFASQIEGTYDLFNFLHQPNIGEWFKLVGIKYAFFPPNPRKKIWSETEKIDRKIWVDFVSNLPGFKKMDWPISFPALSLENSQAHIFGQNKAFLVVGDEDVYDSLFEVAGFNLPATGFIFPEQGNVDLETLFSLLPESLDIIFNQTEKIALSMGFLKDKMIPVGSFTKTDWAIRDSSDYLHWKYELSTNGIKTSAFDYSKGIAFSTIPGEELKFELKVPRDGSYYLLVRSVSIADSFLKIEINKQTLDVPSHPRFNWTKIGPLALNKGSASVSVINVQGVSALNTIVLTDEESWLSAQNKSEKMLARFKNFNISDSSTSASFIKELREQPIEIKQVQINPTQYQIKLQPQVNWLIFSDRFDKGWQIKNLSNTKHVPFYAMINGFSVNEISGDQILEYTPQRYVFLSIILSVSSLVLILGAVTIYKFKKT